MILPHNINLYVFKKGPKFHENKNKGISLINIKILLH